MGIWQIYLQIAMLLSKWVNQCSLDKNLNADKNGCKQRGFTQI